MTYSKLTITYVTSGNVPHEIDDSICDYELKIELDPSEMSSHQLFSVFAKLLASMGYCEFAIMKGACSLAFNDTRDVEMMNRLVAEYELAEIPQEVMIKQSKIRPIKT